MDNSVMFQGFEWYIKNDGYYYKNMKEKVKELYKSGFNSIWLPPFCKATNSNDVGYGIYDLYDLGEFNQKGTVRTKYGTKKELMDLIDELHKYGILVYADIILNQKAGADKKELFLAMPVDPNNRNVKIGDVRNIEGWTSFNFNGRNNKYSNFKWFFEHFSGVDYDDITKEKGVFMIVGDNKGWEQGVSKERGNYDYLMFADIDHNHPDVKRELFNWSIWLINELKLDGMRFDALKHIDDIFIKEFMKNIRDNGEKTDNFYFFGEYWITDPNDVNKYLYDTKYNMDLFDVALHYNIEEASKNAYNYDMRKIFDNTIVSQHPEIAVTFVDNHDSEPGQALESFTEEWFNKIAYGLILLRKDGYPCVFYGDYYGINGNYNINPKKEMIDNLINIRKKYAYGKQDDYFNSKKVIGWVRMGDDNHKRKLAVVISIGDMARLKMYVGKEEAGKKYTDKTLGNKNEIIIDNDGYGEFEVGPGTLSAWSENSD